MISASSKLENRLTSSVLTRLGLGSLLFLIAFIPRFYLTTTSRFTDDEAIFWNISKKIAEGEARPILGHPISGGKASHPGSVFYYLMSVSQIFSKTPEAANIFVALINSAAVVLYWLALETVFTAFPALITAIMFACSPWNLLASDRIWASNVVNVFVLIAFWSALKLRQRPSSPWLIALVLTAGLLPQIHLTAPIVWVSLGALIWNIRRELNYKILIIGMGLLLLAYTPYLASELKTGFSNLGFFLSESGGKGLNSNFLRVPLYAFRFLTTDISFHQLMGYWSSYRESQAFIAMVTGVSDYSFSILRLVLCLASIGFALWACKAMFKRGGSVPQDLIDFRRSIVLGLGCNLTLLLLTRKNFYAHYSLPLIPFIFAVYANLLQEVAVDSKKRKLASVLVVAFILGGIETALTVSRQIDGRNSLKAERFVLETVLANPKIKEKGEIGLQFTFPGGSPLAYELLAREIYGTNLRVLPSADEFNFELKALRQGVHPVDLVTKPRKASAVN